jgi:hypothetical protein
MANAAPATLEQLTDLPPEALALQILQRIPDGSSCAADT